MQIIVSLNTQATNSAEIRAELDAELHGLEQDQDDLHITSQKKEVEAGALGLFEAYQFIVEYGQAIATGLPLVTAVLQLSNAILQRRAIKRKTKPKRKGGAKKSSHSSEHSASQAAVIVQVN